LKKIFGNARLNHHHPQIKILLGLLLPHRALAVAEVGEIPI
jgi:hypothetical protein